MDRRRFMKLSGGATLFSSMAPIFSFPFSGGLNSGTPHICIFSKHLQWLGYEEMARLAREIGFTGIDLTVREGGHVEPENAGRDLPEAVNPIRKEGMEVPMITTEITDPEDPLTRQILESAGKLGIPVYMTGWFTYRQGMRVEDQLKQAAEQLRNLQDLNRSIQIAASYQNHSGGYTWDTSEGATIWNVPLGEGLVPFQLYFGKLKELGIRADFSLHLEYPLGGAEDGSGNLEISEDEFVKQVKADLHYLERLVEGSFKT